MKNGYALLKACMEDQPDAVSQYFAVEMADKIGATYDRVQVAVGRAIGRGDVIDYDAIINETLSGGSASASEIGAPGETPLTPEQAALTGIEGEGAINTSGQPTVNLPKVSAQ